jgi:hypothetical protein
MARLSSLKEALVLSVKNWRLWLLQFLGNAAIFLAFLWWLRLPVANWWHVVLHLLIVPIIAAALVLHGGTLNYFQSAHEDKIAPLLPAFKKALRHVAAIALWALIFFALRALIGGLGKYELSFPGYLRSEFPAWLRRIIGAPTLINVYIGSIFLLRWVVLPGLLLPFALFCSDKGFRGFISFGDWRRILRSLAYWIVLVITAIVGFSCVYVVANWKLAPETATLHGEEVSLFFRLLLAYLLSLFSWLLVCSMLGRTRVVRQPSV